MMLYQDDAAHIAFTICCGATPIQILTDEREKRVEKALSRYLVRIGVYQLKVTGHGFPLS